MFILKFCTILYSFLVFLTIVSLPIVLFNVATIDSNSKLKLFFQVLLYIIMGIFAFSAGWAIFDYSPSVFEWMVKW